MRNGISDAEIQKYRYYPSHADRRPKARLGTDDENRQLFSTDDRNLNAIGTTDEAVLQFYHFMILCLRNIEFCIQPSRTTCSHSGTIIVLNSHHQSGLVHDERSLKELVRVF